MIEKVSLAVLAAVLVLVGAYIMFMKGGDVSSTEARQLVQAGARLIDVRSSAEFAAGHIPGALNIPVQELGARLNELRPKDAPVVVYCRSGHRSGTAARLLKNAGFAAVHDLGPMSRW